MKRLIDTQPICPCTAIRRPEYKNPAMFPAHEGKSAPLNIIQCLNFDGGDMKSSYQRHQKMYLDGSDVKFHSNTIKKQES